VTLTHDRADRTTTGCPLRRPVDVDPPVADHVLTLLRDAGVTAVAEPLAGDRGLARDTRPPRRPTDRVHVDSGRLDLAQQVVGAALPSLRADFHADAARRADAADMAGRPAPSSSSDDLAPDDVESLFADIVAGYDAPATDPVPRWSVLEDAEALPPFEPPERPALSSRLLRSSGPTEPAAVPDHEVDDHFVPDPPPPLPESDRVTRLAWAAAGPLIVPATRSHRSEAGAGGCAARSSEASAPHPPDGDRRLTTTAGTTAVQSGPALSCASVRCSAVQRNQWGLRNATAAHR
jgi:hypothetical protein